MRVGPNVPSAEGPKVSTEERFYTFKTTGPLTAGFEANVEKGFVKATFNHPLLLSISEVKPLPPAWKQPYFTPAFKDGSWQVVANAFEYLGGTIEFHADKPFAKSTHYKVRFDWENC